MADRKYRYALISKFEQHCKINGLPKPVINKNAEQWSADALLESFDLDELYNAMSYYFRVSTNPTWKKFSYEADRLIMANKAYNEDLEFRRSMREKAKEWLT